MFFFLGGGWKKKGISADKNLYKVKITKRKFPVSPSHLFIPFLFPRSKSFPSTTAAPEDNARSPAEDTCPSSGKGEGEGLPEAPAGGQGHV